MNRPAGTSVPVDRRVGGHRPTSTRPLMAALAITQTIGYGALYYAFAVLLVPTAADLHTSTTAVTGAFTAAVLTSGFLAVPIGRWLDRHGGRALMTGGSLLGTLLLLVWSQVEQLWQLYAVQIGIGAASAASLYEAAFAVIIAWHPSQRRPSALLALTVVAGFASTIFLPLTGWLVDQHGWRSTLLIRAAGFTAHTAAISAYTVLLVAALVAWGHPPAVAATVAGLLGVLSVAGRLITTGLQRRHRTTTITAAIFAIQAASALLLPAAQNTTVATIVAVFGFGLGFGVATIAKPVILAERYDTRRYATLAGVLVVPITLAKAGAPLAAATLHTHTGTYATVLTAIATCCAIAAAALVAAGRRGAA